MAWAKRAEIMRKALFSLILLLVASINTALGAQGDIERLPMGLPGPMQGNGASYHVSMTPDGRFIAFSSFAANLVENDTNYSGDIFVYDQQTGALERVSVRPDGVEGNRQSNSPAISGNGRYVAFASEADNLVPDDTNGREDIFVHDRQTGETRRVSVDSNGVAGNDRAYEPSISFAGRYVAFYSAADNLVANDTNGTNDVFVHDMDTGETTRVSVDSSGVEGNGYSVNPAISGNGRYVAFRSAANNLVAGDTNGVTDIFVHDRDTGATTRVSVDSSGVQGNGNSFTPAISGGGRYVAFRSDASNLVANDTNGARDIFVHDRNTGETTRVSVSSDGDEGNGNSDTPAISADGRYVTFISSASNLVTGDTNGRSDVFIHDRQTGLTERVSVNSAGAQANDSTFARPAVSNDGRFVAFSSAATNLVANDTNGRDDIFLRDRQAETTDRISLGPITAQGNAHSVLPRISADGCQVLFESNATNLVADDNNQTGDIFVYDCQTRTITRVSVASDGSEANDRAYDGAISANGRFVAFASGADNLVANDANGWVDIFVHDRQSGVTTRVSVASDGSEADSNSYRPALSANGRYVAFESDASNLVADDSNSRTDIFVHDRQTGATTRVSVSSAGVQANGDSFGATMSDDGRYVAFASYADNLTADPDNGYIDMYVHDRQTGVTELISVASDGGSGNDDSDGGMISGNGRYLVFASYASNLVPDDTNDYRDIFVRDRQTGITERVSLSSSGDESNEESSSPAISADGRYVAFDSYADNLAPDDTNETEDIFVHDRQTGILQLVSRSSSGGLAELYWGSYGPTLSASGGFVAFYSYASNLVDDDTNGFSDIFRHELDLSPEVVSISRADANPTAAASVNFTVTFSEVVTGVTADDFGLTTSGSIQGAAVSGVSGSGDSYTVTVATGSGLGDIRLDVAATADIVDASGKLLANRPFTGGEAYTIVEQAETLLFLPLVVR